MSAMEDTKRRIVVGIDGSESSLDALRWAARIAAALQCPLEAISVWVYPPVFEADPTLAVLSAGEDGPIDHLVVGMALERVLLAATGEGLQASFLNQALEYDDTRVAVQQLTGKPGFAQMVIRFSNSPATAATPRRPVADVIRFGPGDQG